ncbi:Janus/Ocnus family (Ocnus) [Popillia japonica]|uniref:Janus/Ocnus family (Ocnus) n=1 Tax=Popillia japonica TaxID=7064 RepID=A0AAW1ITG8_POPJA
MLTENVAQRKLLFLKVLLMCSNHESIFIYMGDINDKVTEQLQKLKSDGVLKDWQTKVLGGGRIAHDAAAKAIKVYGYSQGYGKADHQVAVALIKKFYPNYAITWSDEGY